MQPIEESVERTGGEAEVSSHPRIQTGLGVLLGNLVGGGLGLLLLAAIGTLTLPTTARADASWQDVAAVDDDR